MSARTLRRTGKRVAPTLEDVSDKITEVADPVREETEKAGGDSARTRSIGAARGVASRSTLLRATSDRVSAKRADESGLAFRQRHDQIGSAFDRRTGGIAHRAAAVDRHPVTQPPTDRAQHG